MTPRMRLVLTTLMVCALAACDRCGAGQAADAGAVDAGPPILAEKEPNDGPSNALSLERSDSETFDARWKHDARLSKNLAWKLW